MPTLVTAIFEPDLSRPRAIPLFGSTVAAGFPLPADDYLERDLDLNFYVRVSGASMENAGIRHNDVLVVDKSLESRDGSIVFAVIDGALTVKRLQRRNSEGHLMPENPNPFAPFALPNFIAHMGASDFRSPPLPSSLIRLVQEVPTSCVPVIGSPGLPPTLLVRLDTDSDPGLASHARRDA